MNRRGVTLIELLMTMIIGGIAFFALSVPFMAERNFWNSGKRQTLTQDDAHMAMRTIARTARQSAGYNAALGSFAVACGNESFTASNGQLTLTDCDGNAHMLIDGSQSRVGVFSITAVSTNIIDVHIQVIHQGGAENENLQSRILMRNAA